MSPRRRLVGADAVSEALAEGAALRLVVHADGPLSAESWAAIETARSRGVRVLAAGDPLLWRLTAASPGVEVLGLVGPPPDAILEDTLAGPGAAWLLTGTAYPGNAGFVIRTAEVSGADGALIDAEFDRAARRETLRAAMRADRYMPVHFASAAQVLELARAAGRRVIAIETTGQVAPWQLDLTGAVLFVVGGERHGIPAPVLEAADAVVTLPMAGFITSYNLQAAMAAVAGERLRQEARG